jgi:hypothetical protein
MILLDNVSVQDRDLLTRLTGYFASLEARVKEGQGWLIFNANRARAGRITRFVLDRLAEHKPFISYYFVPWRDFALNAYMVKIELPSNPPPADAAASTTPSGLVVPGRVSLEHDIAERVSRDQYYQMRFTDVLVVSGLAPAHRHEVEHLDAVLVERFAKRLPSILVSPRAPHELMADYAAHPGGAAAWTRLYDGMYASSLIAL